MPILRATLILSLLLYSSLSYADGQAQAATWQPIHVEADEFEVNLQNQKAIWRGDVHATQGNYTFRASSLTVHLDQVNSNQTSSQQSSESNSTEPAGFELSANSLSYDLEADRIVGQGQSELRRGMEMIRAEHIVYRIQERLAVAKPESNGRVFVQFFSNPAQPIFGFAAPLAAVGGE